ncbi:hypothetical protein LVD15_02810 [Fulvivirga maritima]|uniref:hypothetical protein n=1 Tax=Fulvivirga maritima TaxID=2904247 RepID=UPI001F2E3CE0|nr:hypothetical protein [Fulvivirga maritima]UII27378.1 hypothetical protein LVD15_02810 [Fulvivirga maritima]
MGVPVETEDRFYARVSERLRHKNRLVTPWDYEHLILSHFPMVKRVVCITPADGFEEVKGGEVVIVVVPDIDRNRAFYLPKIDFKTLGEIRGFVLSHASHFVSVKVMNPVYERVKINCNLKFNDNSKKGEYITRLHEELQQFLCPWFYRTSAGIQFWGSVKHEEVLTFLESREYVTFITKLSVVVVHHSREEYSISDSMDGPGLLRPSTPWSILVPMEKHQINIIEKTIHEVPEKAAIESMRLGGDFVITESPEEKWDMPTSDKDKGDDADYFIVEIDI